MATDDPTVRETPRSNGGVRRMQAAARQRRDTRQTLDGLSFDEALLQLEQTVAALEGGQLTLDESLALFERGMHLAQHCQQVLDGAELRVHQLVVDDGEPGALAFETLEIDVE